jgi:hypothetical protein
MGELRVMNQKGHETFSWDPAKPEEVLTARAKFDELKAKGYTAIFGGKRLDAFDSLAGNVDMIAPLAGG